MLLHMPIFAIRLSDEELAAAERAAARQQLTRSEFARHALTAAAAPAKKPTLRGALKGRYTYQQAMKLLRG